MLRVQKVYKKKFKNWVYIKWILNDGTLNEQKEILAEISEVQFHHYLHGPCNDKMSFGNFCQNQLSLIRS